MTSDISIVVSSCVSEPKKIFKKEKKKKTKHYQVGKKKNVKGNLRISQARFKVPGIRFQRLGITVLTLLLHTSFSMNLLE